MLLSAVGVNVHKLTCLHSGKSFFALAPEKCCNHAEGETIEETCCENELIQLQVGTFQKCESQPQIQVPAFNVALATVFALPEFLKHQHANSFQNRPPPLPKQPLFIRLQSFLC
jgi:hypothetical protein